jgi:cell division protein FtsB
MDSTPTPSRLAAPKRRRAARPPASTDAADRPKLPPRRQSSPWLRRSLVFVSCVLALDGLFGDRGLAETMRAKQEFADAAASLNRLKQENAALVERARRLTSDPRVLESVAREELGLVRPGEILVTIRDLDAATRTR